MGVFYIFGGILSLLWVILFWELFSEFIGVFYYIFGEMFFNLFGVFSELFGLLEELFRVFY